MNRWVLIIVALGFTVMALACGKKEEAPQAAKPLTAKQVQQEATQALEALKTYTAQQKAAYQKKVGEQLAEIHQKMEELRGKVDKATPAVKARLEKELGGAKQDLDTFDKSLEEMKTATAKAWDNLKNDLNQIEAEGQKSEKSENKGK
jgi:hypothetical protein